MKHTSTIFDWSNLLSVVLWLDLFVNHSFHSPGFQFLIILLVLVLRVLDFDIWKLHLDWFQFQVHNLLHQVYIDCDRKFHPIHWIRMFLHDLWFIGYEPYAMIVFLTRFGGRRNRRTGYICTHSDSLLNQFQNLFLKLK